MGGASGRGMMFVFCINICIFSTIIMIIIYIVCVFVCLLHSFGYRVHDWHSSGVQPPGSDLDLDGSEAPRDHRGSQRL